VVLLGFPPPPFPWFGQPLEVDCVLYSPFDAGLLRPLSFSRIFPPFPAFSFLSWGDRNLFCIFFSGAMWV